MSDTEEPDWVLAAFDLLAAWNGRSLEWHSWSLYDLNESDDPGETRLMVYPAASWVLPESREPDDVLTGAQGAAQLIQFLLSSQHLAPTPQLVTRLCESIGESLVVRAQEAKLKLDELAAAVEVCPPLEDAVRVVW